MKTAFAVTPPAGHASRTQSGADPVAIGTKCVVASILGADDANQWSSSIELPRK